MDKKKMIRVAKKRMEAGKADKAADKKAGIKEGSAQDETADAGQMAGNQMGGGNMAALAQVFKRMRKA